MEDYDADPPSWEMFDAQIDWPATLARNFASFAGFTPYSRRLSEMKEYFSPRLLDGEYIPIKAVARLLAGETDENPQLTGEKPQAKAKRGRGRSLVGKLREDICRIWGGPHADRGMGRLKEVQDVNGTSHLAMSVEDATLYCLREWAFEWRKRNAIPETYEHWKAARKAWKQKGMKEDSEEYNQEAATLRAHYFKKLPVIVLKNGGQYYSAHQLLRALGCWPRPEELFRAVRDCNSREVNTCSDRTSEWEALPDWQVAVERDDAFDPAMVAEEVMDAPGGSFGVKELWAAGSVGGGASSSLEVAGGQLAGASTSAGSAHVSGGAPSHRDLVSTVVNLAVLTGRDVACALEDAVRQYEAWAPEGETAVVSNFRQEALRQLVEVVNSPPQIDESKFAESARRSEETNAKLDAAVEAKRNAGILDPERPTMVPNAAGTAVVPDDSIPDLTLAEQVAAGMVVVIPKCRPEEGGETGHAAPPC